MFGKCGGALQPQPVKISKPIPSPVEAKPPVTTTGGGTGPVLSDPSYGKPAGGTQTSSGNGGGGGGRIESPSPGTTTKPF